ncbi:MAG: AAA family ATPase [Fibrobacter sp.]|nr:AAA family ATPase [Fibrobacter sp.]
MAKSIGGITYKTINGKRYAYYQWMENGKQRSRRVKDEELPSLLAEIEQRKAAKANTTLLTNGLVLCDNGVAYFAGGALAVGMNGVAGLSFKTDVKLGASLKNFSANVLQWKKRDGFERLRDYIFGPSNDRVFILYGLRRTGKTTLIRQLFGEMAPGDLAKAAFVQVNSRNSLADVNADLKILDGAGFKYVFIDEVTMLADFIEGAALFADVFASCGMKIVLSGTDSLGFVFSEDEQLYDRTEMLHTTFIPYREFERVLGLSGIDEYIQYGGTMSMGGCEYNKDRFTFANVKSANEYVDSAIAKNIQHSLKCYQYEGHFRSLKSLYEAGELTNAINRIVEDINHRFTLDVLTRDFRSSDLSLSAKNLRRDRFRPTDILDRVDVNHVREIREYLDLLDLTVDIDVENFGNFNQRERLTTISQPGLRYAQAKALIDSLLLDDAFRSCSLVERKSIAERILNEIKGRMMEEIVLLETKMARPNCRIFKLQFAVGEFDMVVANPENATCEIYEIKHSEVAAKEQHRHLKNVKKCNDTEFRYGTILSKNVIYRGASRVIDEINYLNVEEYLKGLDDNIQKEQT